MQVTLAAIVFPSTLKNLHFPLTTHVHLRLLTHTLSLLNLPKPPQNTPIKMEPPQPPPPTTIDNPLTTPSNPTTPTQGLSKRAQKKQLKQQRYEQKKAEKKLQEKEQKQREKQRKKNEWEEKLLSITSEEEKLKLIESRRGVRKERMEKKLEEKEKKIERLSWGKLNGQNIVIDLEFSNLMTSNELNSLVQQIMYCYAVNSRCTSPSHLWLTGCEGNMGTHLHRLPGFDKWMIEKENQSYIETFQDKKEKLVYLTADAETVLDDLNPEKIYIIGGLVDRNRWKGLTLKKAQEQGIEAAKLPIGNYLKMSSSQVLTVNQVVEILLKYLEIRDWKTSFFQVIPQRKRCEADSGDHDLELKGEVNRVTENDSCAENQKKMRLIEADLEASEGEAEISETVKINLSRDADSETASIVVAFDESEKGIVKDVN